MGSVVGGIVGGLGGMFSGNEEARRLERSGRIAQQELARGRDFVMNETGFGQAAEQGTGANNMIASLLGIGGDPAAAQQAFSQFQDSTGFNFRLGEGINAIENSQAAQGLLNSGATLKGINSFGQNMASQEFQNFLGQLTGVADRGFNADQVRANAATGTATNTAQALSGANSEAAAARRDGQNNFFGGLGGVLGSIF